MSGNMTPDLADRLSAYLDGALSDADRAEIEALVAADATVAEELAALHEADAAIGSAFASMLEAPIPLALVSAIGKAPAMPGAANLPHRPVWGFGTLAAALALLMIGAGAGSVVTRIWSGATPTEVAAAPGWLDQVAEYHRVYAAQERHLAEVPATEVAHIETWLAASTGVTFTVPDLAAEGLTFQGGRLLVAAGKPVGQLMYTNADGQVVALCFIAGGDTSATEGQFAFTDRSFADLDMVVWKDRDASYVAIGPAGSGIDLDRIAKGAAVSI